MSNIDNDIAYIQQEWKKLTNAAIVFWESNKGTLLSRTWNMTTSFVGTVTNVVIGVVFAIYILLDKERLAHSGRRAVYAFCSRENAGYWLNAASLSKKVFAGFVGGQLLEAFLLGLMCFAGMLILSMPYALVISALVAFLALVPIIGTMVSAVIGCVFILISQPEKVLPFIIFFIVLQRIEGDILYPRVVGKSVGLSGLWVLAAVTVGGGLFGITGMIISVVIKVRRGEIFSAVFEEGTWFVLFIGIACLALGVGNIAGVPVVIVIGAVMLFIGSAKGKKGFGIISGFIGAIYNGVTGYFGDILSYSRLMALMLAGSVIAQVFNTIGAIAGNIFVFLLISIVGNALNFALNLLGCFVHDLRLQCLEYFGKFYEDGGKPFRPLAINTTYVSVTNDK